LSQQTSTLPIKFYQRHARVLNHQGRWLAIAWLAALVDGKLLLAVALSTLTYQAIKHGAGVPWDRVEPAYQRLWAQVGKLGRSPLLAGSLAFATTYGFAAAWSELGGGWAATTLVGLGLGNLLFILREGRSPDSAPGFQPAPTPATSVLESPPEADLERHWQNLTAADPLRRLLAVRALLHYSLSQDETDPYLPGTDITLRSHLVDCFRLMLTHESEPLVRVALIEGLKALHPKPQLGPGQPALQPLERQANRTVVQRSVEYVEP
jgi:hypothetical protein